MQHWRLLRLHGPRVTGHHHVWRRATLRHADGTVIPGGRRCACGREIVGDGPLALNADVVRAARGFNEAVVAGITDLAARLEADRRRRFP